MSNIDTFEYTPEFGPGKVTYMYPIPQVYYNPQETNHLNNSSPIECHKEEIIVEEEEAEDMEVKNQDSAYLTHIEDSYRQKLHTQELSHKLLVHLLLYILCVAFDSLSGKLTPTLFQCFWASAAILNLWLLYETTKMHNYNYLVIHDSKHNLNIMIYFRFWRNVSLLLLICPGIITILFYFVMILTDESSVVLFFLGNVKQVEDGIYVHFANMLTIVYALKLINTITMKFNSRDFDFTIISKRISGDQ